MHLLFKYTSMISSYRWRNRYGTPRGQDILVSSRCIRQNLSSGSEERQYKRVAVVEDFFEIIYGVHVEMDGRGGKHAGQKRTYRAIAETYSFLPREAVTRFLMACSDCQKRMHLSLEHNNNHNDNDNDDDNEVDDHVDSHDVSETRVPRDPAPPIIDFSLPITTTYLTHMRTKSCYPDDPFMIPEKEDSITSADTELSVTRSASPLRDVNPLFLHGVCATPTDLTTTASPVAVEHKVPPTSLLQLDMAAVAKTTSDTSATPTLSATNGTAPEEPTLATSATGSVKSEDRGHPERKRRASQESLESSTRTSETGGADDQSKEDEDDDGDEEDEKITGHNYDPERLKSFNMFVRLFVDENLDRMVPISKQPKDKIQAILDACDRQFPEFHERARKRIRTYLKSCRRMRRSKENGWEALRPTPPHLTSAAAEAILAQACENESNNAKRMRMGLDPLPAASLPSVVPATATPTPSRQGSPACPSQPSPSPQQQQPQQQQTPQVSAATTVTASTTTAPTITQTSPSVPAERGQEFLRAHVAAPAAGGAVFRHELPAPFFANSNGIFRPGFPTFQPPAHQHGSTPPAPAITTAIQNGTATNRPTDLSMKKSSGSPSKNQLNPNEVATIKQLIAGYRESAAFLYRSADELDQLLLQQN